MTHYEPEEAQRLAMDALVRLTEDHQRHGLKEIAKELDYKSKSSVSRYFKEKSLPASAIGRELQRVDATVPDPTDDLVADLEILSRNYYDYFINNPFLMFMLPEIAADDGLKEELQRHQEGTKGKLAKLYKHHHDNKSWCDAVQAAESESLVDLLIPLLGGIFTRLFWYQVGLAEKDFDEKAYVAAFLGGYGCERVRKQLVAKRLISELEHVFDIENPREKNSLQRETL